MDHYKRRVTLKNTHWPQRARVAVTLKRIQDGENVVEDHASSTVGKEGETPGDSHHAAQPHNGHDVHTTSVDLTVFSFGLPDANNPREYDDKCGEGEEEDQAVVTNVDNQVDVVVR